MTAISGGQTTVGVHEGIDGSLHHTFGDEPTETWMLESRSGNLLSSELKAKSGTACIVSHDIPLALKYADSIHL